MVGHLNPLNVMGALSVCLTGLLPHLRLSQTVLLPATSLERGQIVGGRVLQYKILKYKVVVVVGSDNKTNCAESRLTTARDNLPINLQRLSSE